MSQPRPLAGHGARVWRLGADVDTDALAPGHAMKHGMDTIARFCLEQLRPDFAALGYLVALAFVAFLPMPVRTISR